MELMKNIIFIFARSGSKGLKNKNIKQFFGKPLLYWTIQQAKKIKDFDEIILSTDSKKIANIGKRYGAKIYFLRPKNLALDNSPEWFSWKHAVKFLINKKKYIINKILVLPITSPCRSIQDINGCINLFDSKKYDSVMGISRTSLNPSFNMVIKSKKSHKINLLMQKSKKIFQRQQLANTYKLTTVAIVTKPEIILKKKRLFDGSVGGYHIPEDRAIDIDTISDFNYCEYLFKKK
jgi:N-acylneuraminate cytidylyltransferase